MLNVLIGMLSNEVSITVFDDTEPIEVFTQEVESSNSTEIELLQEIRDLQQIQVSYTVFFIVITICSVIIFKLYKFIKLFFN